MKLISIFSTLAVALILGYLWVVVRIFIGTQELEWLVWTSPYLKELFLWLVIGVPLILYFQNDSDDDAKNDDGEQSEGEDREKL